MHVYGAPGEDWGGGREGKGREEWRQMVEVCGREEREKLVDQSSESVPQRTCESTQGTQAPTGLGS